MAFFSVWLRRRVARGLALPDEVRRSDPRRRSTGVRDDPLRRQPRVSRGLRDPIVGTVDAPRFAHELRPPPRLLKAQLLVVVPIRHLVVVVHKPQVMSVGGARRFKPQARREPRVTGVGEWRVFHASQHRTTVTNAASEICGGEPMSDANPANPSEVLPAACIKLGQYLTAGTITAERKGGTTLPTTPSLAEGNMPQAAFAQFLSSLMHR